MIEERNKKKIDAEDEGGDTEGEGNWCVISFAQIDVPAAFLCTRPALLNKGNNIKFERIGAIGNGDYGNWSRYYGYLCGNNWRGSESIFHGLRSF